MPWSGTAQLFVRGVEVMLCCGCALCLGNGHYKGRAVYVLIAGGGPWVLLTACVLGIWGSHSAVWPQPMRCGCRVQPVCCRPSARVLDVIQPVCSLSTARVLCVGGSPCAACPQPVCCVYGAARVLYVHGLCALCVAQPVCCMYTAWVLWVWRSPCAACSRPV